MRLKIEDEFLVISPLIDSCGNLSWFLSQEAVILLVKKLMNSFLLISEEIDGLNRAMTLCQPAVLFLRVMSSWVVMRSYKHVFWWLSHALCHQIKNVMQSWCSVNVYIDIKVTDCKFYLPWDHINSSFAKLSLVIVNYLLGENNTFVFLSGTFFLRQGQAPLPSSLLQPLVTPWQLAQCTHHLPGHCQGIPCLGPPSSSRNPPSTALGGKFLYIYT